MKKHISSGLICIRNNLNIEFSLCKIDYIINEDETYSYVFTPYYDVIDLLGFDTFNGIPGLDLSLRKESYIRDNILPVFISERVPSENREDFYELLQEVDLTYMDPIEYLCRTKLVYSGDHLYVKPFNERKSIILENYVKKSNSTGIMKIILDNIASGNIVKLKDGTIINNQSVFSTLSFIYGKSYFNMMSKIKEGICNAKTKGKYKGRKPSYVDFYSFLEQNELFEKHQINAKDAAKNIGISIDKFYRLRKSKKQIN